MKVKIRSLTPVHVGNGGSYGYGEAYVDGDTLHRCEIDYSRDPSLVDKVMKNIENIGYIQKILREYGKDLYTAKLFRTSIYFKTRTSVREHIKIGNIPYFPGSTIKGAIRTLLYAYYLHVKNFEIDTPKGIKNFLDLLKFGDDELGIKALGRGGEDRKAKTYGKRFEQLVFTYLDCSGTDKKDQCKWKDAKYDIMKFVEVSDFIPMNYQLYVDRIKTYSKGAGGIHTIFAETVEGEFEGSVAISPSIKHVVKNDKINKEKLVILGLSENDLEDKNEATKKFLKHLEGASKYFYDTAMKYDRDTLRFWHPHEVQEEDFKLRFGFGVGTHYQTILKLLERENKNIVKKIIGQNELNRGGKRYGNYKNLYPAVPYPKSYECIEHGGKRIPLGWVKVIV